MKNSKSILKAIALLMFLFSFNINSQGQNLSKDQMSQVEGLYKQYDSKQSPGGVILAMRDGEIIYSQAFGMANLAYDIPFKTHTPTNIGSTSKQFTAFAIAMLEEDGELSIEDDIRKYIPELPDLGDTVRIRHLISHTSGYREYLNSLLMSGRNMSDHISRDEIIPMIQRQGKLQNDPGETFNYNNTGYALLSMVVEKVTGQDFPTWMRENIFLPLGMENTTVRSNPGEIISGHAQGYTVEDENKIFAVNDIYSSMGAGGIYSTADDLAKWVSNFFKPVLGNTEIIEKIQTPFTLNSGESSTYAYGLLAGELNGMKMIQHGGADMAHRSNLMMFPEIRGAVITQSNHSDFPNDIAGKIAGILFGDKMEAEKQDEPVNADDFIYHTKKFDNLAGRYELEVMPGFVLEFTREDDKIYAQATSQPRFEIFPSSDSTFYYKVVEASMTFHINEEGISDSLTLHQNGNHKARRITVPAWEPSDSELEMYKGSYFSEELETFYRVTLNDKGKLVLRHRRIDDIPLKADAKDKYSGAFPILTLEFIRNEDDEVIGFMASSGRSFGILFNKK